MYIVVVVIINLNFCGNERIVDVVFILYFVVRRVVNNFDGYIDVLGIFGFLDYINFVRYFSVISRFVVEEYIIGRFGCIEIIIGQYVFCGRGLDKNGYFLYVNYYVF